MRWIWACSVAAVGAMCLASIFAIFKKAGTWYDRIILALFMLVVVIVFSTFIRFGVF